jgi:hypothetical protein
MKIGTIDNAVAEFFYSNHIAFNVATSDSYKRMVHCLKQAPSSYVAPSSYKIGNPLLEESYNTYIALLQSKLDQNSRENRGLTIVSDGATIHKRPYTNVVAICPSAQHPLLLGIDDATEHYQEGGIKDADYHYSVLKEPIEDIGATNVTLVITDDASVMNALRVRLETRWKHILVCCCLCHVLNTFLKHVIQGIDEIDTIVKDAQKVLNHFNNHALTQGLLKKFSLQLLGHEYVFIIPSECRFGLFLLMLHRLLLLRGTLLAIIHCPTYSQSDLVNDEVVELVSNEQYFWKPMYELVLYLRPALRLIRIADADKPAMGKVFKLVQILKNHLSDATAVKPTYSNLVLTKFDELLPKICHDIHRAAYCVDPEFWADDVRGMAEVMSSFRIVAEKIFSPYPDKDDKIVALYTQFAIFRDKREAFASTLYQNCSTFEPVEWWRTVVTEYPVLRAFAIKILDLVISSSAAERDWKDFKAFSTKGRSSLSADKVEKMKVVSAGLKIKHTDFDEWRGEMAKFGVGDELLQLDVKLNDSQEVAVKVFKRWLEDDLEGTALENKNSAHEDLLKEKYKHIFFWDGEGGDDDATPEIRRIVDIEWRKKKEKGEIAKYQAVCQLVEQGGEAYHGPEDLVAYAINEALLDMIAYCPPEYNKAFKILNIDD